MGGGKGGSSTTSVQIPAWLEDAAKRNLAKADTISTMGPTPYYGPDVAALSPMQEAAMMNTNMGASAFGLNAPMGTGMPQAMDFGGGVRGYSSAPLYEQARQELSYRLPGQFAALNEPFRDPITGAMPGGVYDPSYMPGAPVAAGGGGSSSSGGLLADRPEGPGRAADLAASRNPSGGGGSFASSQLGSRLPGGVNTRNPSSVGNRVAAAATSSNRTGGAPASSSRPQRNPSRK